MALRGSLDARALLTLRLVWAVAALGAGIALARPALFRLRGTPLRLVVALGIAMIALQYCYYRTIQATSVSTAVFLEFLAPAIVVTHGWLTGRQAREPWSAASVLCAMAGGYLLVVSGSGLRLPPVALATGIGTAVALACQTLLLDRAPEEGSRMGFLFAALGVSALLSLLLGDAASIWRTTWSAATVGVVAYMAIGATIVPMLLIMIAVRHLGPARTGVTATLEPLVAAAAAGILLGERLTGAQAAGGALILAGVACIYRAPRPASRWPPAGSPGAT